MTLRSIALSAVGLIAVGIVVFILMEGIRPTQLPAQEPTGHEQAGEPDKSFEGLADVFDGKPKMEVTTGMVRFGDGLSGFMAAPAAEGRYPA